MARLLGKCLFAYFGGNAPPIRRLVIEDYCDQIADDVLKCWAGCLWAIQALRRPERIIRNWVARGDEFLDLRIQGKMNRPKHPDRDYFAGSLGRFFSRSSRSVLFMDFLMDALL